MQFVTDPLAPKGLAYIINPRYMYHELGAPMPLPIEDNDG